MTTKIKSGKHVFFKRPCEKCKEYFRPTAKFCFVCDECKAKIDWGNWRRTNKSKSIKMKETISN